jgi:Tfp pilus assembly protein PilP
MTPVALLLAILVLAPALAGAQGSVPAGAQGAPPAKPPQAAPAQPAQPQPVEAAPPAAYSYDPESRRDPFLSLLGRGNDPRMTTTRPSGVLGLLISDVTVKGILRDKAGFVAMIQSPDSKTYIIKTGDRLFDGTVKAIVQDKVIFSQDVNDPLSLVKQREVPKAVRPADGRGASPGF